MAYVDVDKAIKKLESSCIRCIDYLNCTHCHVDKAIKELKSLPTADVVEVVRCKDCEHYHTGKESTVCDYDYCDILYYCDGSHRTACEEDFCSYGERRETNGNAKNET